MRKTHTFLLAVFLAFLCSGLKITQHSNHGWLISLTASAHAQSNCEYPPTDEPDGDGDECNPNYPGQINPSKNAGDPMSPGASWNDWGSWSKSAQGGSQGSVSHLGMYVTGTTDQMGWGPGVGAAGGGEVSRSNGYSVTDATFASSTTTGSVRDAVVYGGIFAIYDASRLVPTNQSLLFGGFFQNWRHDISVGPSVGLPAGAGSSHMDNSVFAGSVLYGINTAYFQGTAGFGIVHGDETSTFSNTTGSFVGNEYFVDSRVGNVFVLLNTTGAPNTIALPTKAPSKLAGGYLVGLDLSGRLGYVDSWTNGFTDSGGFMFGTGEAKYGEVGGRARLFAHIPSNGFVWVPYVSGKVDQLFGYSSTLTIPSQPLLPAGDFISLHPALTFWGSELGLNAEGPSGWTLGVKVFYTQSADTIIRGANAFIKIAFGPTAGSRY